MQIKPIDPCAVQVLLPHRDPILLFFAVEKEWYATDDEQLLGALCKNSGACPTECDSCCRWQLDSVA